MELLIGIAGLYALMTVTAARMSQSAEYHRSETDGYRLDLCTKIYAEPTPVAQVETRTSALLVLR